MNHRPDQMNEDLHSLSFVEICEADIPEMTAVMTRAFDDDSRRHRGIERGGPEGYDNGDFFRKWLFGYDETVGYKVLLEGRVVGGVIVWIMPHSHNILGNIFVDPSYQRRGIGKAVWRFIETTYPETKSWRVETPLWATGNHTFYSRQCGFTRVGDSDDSARFRKEMPGKQENKREDMDLHAPTQG